jgi:hypothetical protein
MLMTLIAIAFQRQPKLLLKPKTVATTLFYLAASEMVEGFAGLSLIDGKGRNKRITEWDRRYGMWRSVSARGNEVVVDYERNR